MDDTKILNKNRILVSFFENQHDGIRKKLLKLKKIKKEEKKRSVNDNRK